MEYNNFKIHVNDDGSFKNAEIETSFGVIKIESEKQLNRFIETAAKQKGVSIDEFKKMHVEVTVDAKEETEEKVETEIKAESKPEEKVEPEDEKEEYSHIDGLEKKKGKKGIKRLVATITALGILATGGYHLHKYRNPYENKQVTFVPPQTLTETYETGTASTPDYEAEMDRVVSQQEDTINDIVDITNDNTENMTMDDFLGTLNNVSTLSNANMIEVSNFINGSPIVGTAYYSNFGDTFANEADQAAVKYFSDYRNRIIKCAYEEQNINSTKAAINSAYISLTEFIVLGTPYSLPINGKDITVSYLDLSPMAQATVLNLAMAMFTINQDYTYYASSGALFPKMDTLITISDTLYNDAISYLEETIQKSK